MNAPVFTQANRIFIDKFHEIKVRPRSFLMEFQRFSRTDTHGFARMTEVYRY